MPSLLAKKPKFNGIEILRVFAALLVVVHHATSTVSVRLHGYDATWGGGALGVDIFFVISGFVMVYTSERLMESPRGWQIFAERRLVRILPMYWLATTIMVLARWFLPAMFQHNESGVLRIVSSYLFIPTRSSQGLIVPILPVGWTLVFEMFFYLLFDIALFFRAHIFGFVGTVLAALSIASYFRKQEWLAASVYLDSIVLEFFLGMLIAKLIMKGFRMKPRAAWALLLIGFALLLGPWRLSGPRIIESGLPAAAIILAVACMEEVFARTSAWLLILAESSYVVYLFHMMIILVMSKMIGRVTGVYSLQVAILVVGSSMVAVGMSRWLERPILLWLRDKVRIGKRQIIHTP